MTVTPSPQSVVPVGPKRVLVLKSAVERLILAADMYGVAHLDSDDMDDDAVELQDATEGMKDALAAAPAPLSLAGGEVCPLVQRLAYGYAIMHTTICHMAGTSGASGRWYYDKANEAFGRVSPIHSITEESNPHVNGDYFSGLSNFLAALSPEAPAREGVEPWKEGREEGRLAARPWRKGDPEPAVGSMVLVSGAHGDIDSDQHRAFSWRRVIGYGVDGADFICLQNKGCWPTVELMENCWFAALTPRHEAPAEGAGERIDWQQQDAVAGALHAVLPLDVDWQHMRVAGKAFVDTLMALRARSSAPEAPACTTCGGKGYTEHEGGDGEGYPSRPEIDDCPRCHKAPAEPVSDHYKFDDEIAWLREAARYFSARDTKGEDRAHWANVYNAENARKLADRLAELSSNPCQLEAPAEGAGERERLADAYIAGALSVHEYWIENPGEAPSGDKLRIAVEALETSRENLIGWFEAIDAEIRVEHEMHVSLKDDLAVIDQALATLEAEGKS